MKEHATYFLKGSARATGKSFKKALGVTIPPEVLDNSSFFGGLNRLGDAIVDLGSEGGGEAAGKEYVVRKTGGVVADTAVGLMLFGVPVTMVTSIFSDGCKVVSHVFKGARTEDEEYTHLGAFFGDMSTISNNFMKLFDVPSKEGANDVRESIDTLITRLKKEGRLTASVHTKLKELRKMCGHEQVKCMGDCKPEDKSDLTEDIQERLTEIAEEELSRSKLKMDKEAIIAFLKHPSVPNMKSMHIGILHHFKKQGISIKDRSLRFSNKMVSSLEDFSSKSFHDKLYTIMLKQFSIGHKTHEVIEKKAEYGSRIIYSLFDTTYKGASLFGGHYKRQIKGVIRRGRQRRSQQV